MLLGCSLEWVSGFVLGIVYFFCFWECVCIVVLLLTHCGCQVLVSEWDLHDKW